MELDFAKLHGAGNDFVFIDDFSRSLELTKTQVAWLCDRHKGIGADGVILVRPSADPACAAYMHYINSDGTLAEMCGNGVRCFAKYLVDYGYADPGDGAFAVETLAGVRRISFSAGEDGKLATATVDMGEPRLAPAVIPTSLAANAKTPDERAFVLDAPLDSPWGAFSFTCVSMGNPHAVCFLDDGERLPDALFSDPLDKGLETLDLERVGAFFESHPVFPEKANIEFAVVRDGGIAMRVYERGCGETLACGTGACATSVAACLSGRSGRDNTVRVRGGELSIAWGDDGRVSMTGPAAESFSGRVLLPPPSIRNA